MLAGLIAGLLARGASLRQAAAFGVALHAKAGEILVRRHGRLGFLARELAAEVPTLMQMLAESSSQRDTAAERARTHASTHDSETNDMEMPATGGV